MNILEYIPKGRENAVSRQELTRLTGLNDRANRELIELERRNGEPIIASGKGGYYIADNEEEMERFLKSIDARITSMYFTYLPMRKKVYEAKGVRVTKVHEHFRKLGVDVVEGQIELNEVG